MLLPRRDGRGTPSQVWPLPWACLPQFSLLGGAEVAPGLAVTRRGTPGQKAVFQQGSPCPSPLSCPHSGSLASACVALRVTAFHPLQCLREGPPGVGSVPLGAISWALGSKEMGPPAGGWGASRDWAPQISQSLPSSGASQDTSHVCVTPGPAQGWAARAEGGKSVVWRVDQCPWKASPGSSPSV